jgi:hypothetical protein
MITDHQRPPSFLTKAAKREFERRRELVVAAEILQADYGISFAQTARAFGVSFTSLWRYRKNGCVPLTFKCGRKSLLEKLKIDSRLICRVQRLQAFGGLSNASSWFSLRGSDSISPDLREYLARTKSIAPSLLMATKLQKKTALCGEGFFVVA